jgi:hypothetical protein
LTSILTIDLLERLALPDCLVAKIFLLHTDTAALAWTFVRRFRRGSMTCVCANAQPPRPATPACTGVLLAQTPARSWRARIALRSRQRDRDPHHMSSASVAEHRGGLIQRRSGGPHIVDDHDGRRRSATAPQAQLRTEGAALVPSAARLPSPKN